MNATSRAAAAPRPAPAAAKPASACSPEAMKTSVSTAATVGALGGAAGGALVAVGVALEVISGPPGWFATAAFAAVGGAVGARFGTMGAINNQARACEAEQLRNRSAFED